MKVHPNSLANLELSNGSTPRYEEVKKRRHITVTNPAWDAAKQSIKEELKISVSEAIELIGRGELKLVRCDRKNKSS